MIPERYITEWSEQAPWVVNKFIEQDLIVCRALVSIYSDAFVAEHLAFRGGTALGKLYLKPQPRYSEDIDLVQVKAEPIKETIDHLRDALAWLGEPVVKQKKHNNTLVFKVQPTDMDAGEIHLKVEINCKEHFSVYPMVRVPFAMDSSWFKGACEVLTYELAVGFTASHLPTYKEFLLNMDGKLQDEEFLTDTEMILGPQVEYDPQVAWEKVKAELVERLNPVV